MDERLMTQAASVARGVHGGRAVLGARTTGTGRGPSGEELGALRCGRTWAVAAAGLEGDDERGTVYEEVSYEQTRLIARVVCASRPRARRPREEQMTPIGCGSLGTISWRH
ncbi:hypothetical protein MTO96_011561 [Rhipicephalus appendiculatus]